MVNKILALILGSAFFFASTVWGRILFERPMQRCGRALRWSLSPVLGVAVFIVIMVLLGCFRILYPLLVSAFFYFFIAAGIAGLVYRREETAEAFKAGLIEVKNNSVLILGVAAITTAALSGIFSPETDNDSLCYHMHLVKEYLSRHQIWFHPYEWNSAFPFNLEMLYAAGYAVRGIYLAKFMHYGLAVCTALGIYAFLRGRTEKGIAQSAALLYLTATGVFTGAVTTYVDTGLACFTFFAGAALLAGLTVSSAALIAIAGFLWGIAMGIKFLAVISGVAFAGVIFTGKSGNFKAKLTTACLFFGTGGVTAAFWYIRSWILRGNPVFPYFYSVFRSGDPMMHYDDIGVTKTALHFITIPWTLSIRPDLFEGYSVQFGLYFLMFAPLAFLMRREAWVQSCAVFAFVFTTCWFFLGQSLRFLIPALPFLILVGAAGHAGITAKKGGKIAGAVVLLLLTVNLLFIGYYTRTQWPVALGMESEPAYLMRTQRSYPMAQFVNVNLSPGAKIFSSDESHLFYYDRTITREAIYQRVHHADVSGLPAKDWIARLKAEGYTHLLTVENVAAAAGQTAACASLACLLRTGELPVAEYLKPLYNYDFNYSDQALFYYQLFEIL